MKIFLDTADVAEVRRAAELGLLDGVTTNPTLVARTGRPMNAVLTDICELTKGPVSAEVLATACDQMLAQGRVLAAIAPNVVVKIPLTAEGLRAVRVLAGEGVATNVTLCFSAVQALAAAKAGATWVSPFVGRLDDTGQDGMAVAGEIVDGFRRYGFGTRVLVASVRGPLHVQRALQMGADAATLPFSVLDLLIRHPLTDVGLARFLADAKAIPPEPAS